VKRPPRSRWSSFIADGAEARSLHEVDNPAHRLRVEHNRDTILVHLSDEDGHGWTVLAVEPSEPRVGGCRLAPATRCGDGGV
jgi:hypothetical protein